MVHFIDQKDVAQTSFEDHIFQIAAINDRVSTMDKLEGLNKDFQTKVCWSCQVIIDIKINFFL